VGDAIDVAEAHRQHGLRALQRLNLALFVDAQDDRVIRRVEVQPDDVPNLLDEQRVGRQLEAPGAVRLDPEQPEVALHRAFRDPAGRGRATDAPVRTDARAALQDRRQQVRHRLVIMAARAPGPLLTVEPGQTLLEEPLAPVTDRWDREADLPRDLGVRAALCRCEHDPCPAHQTMRCRPRADQIAQTVPLHLSQLDLLFPRPAHNAPPEAQEQHATAPPVAHVISGTLH
jgi:hypothetical protein